MEKIEKPISRISIEYEDGSQDNLEYYAAVGISGDTWYRVMLSPRYLADKIKMNNLLVDLANLLFKEVGEFNLKEQQSVDD